MTSYKDVHIGRLIQQKVDEQHLSYSEFARQIHSSRTNLYHLFDCKSIDIERLIRISEVLHCDLIHEAYFSQARKSPVENLPSIVLPIKDGRICVEGLSQELRNMIAESL